MRNDRLLTRYKMKTVLAVISCLLFVLCGCVNPEDTLRNPVGTDENAVYSDVIVGVALPLTGKYSLQGNEMLPGAQAAVDEINMKRGLAGRRVRLEVCDTKSNPLDAAAAVRTLAAKGASVVVGGYSTTETHGMAGAAQSERVPLVISCASADAFSNINPFIFRTSCTDTQLAEGLAAYLWYWRQIGQIAVLIDMRPESEYERNVARSVAQSFSDLGGNVVKTSEYTDVASCVKAMREVMSFGPKAITVAAAGKEAAMMVTALRKLGYEGVICGADGWDGDEFFATLGKEVAVGECIFVSFFSNEYKDDEFALFSEYFRKKFYHLPGSRATAVRDAVVMACNSLAGAGDIKAFRRNWMALQNFFGASSVYNPLKSGDVDRMIFVNSISPAGTARDYPAPRLIRGFMHSKLESYKFD